MNQMIKRNTISAHLLAFGLSAAMAAILYTPIYLFVMSPAKLLLGVVATSVPMGIVIAITGKKALENYWNKLAFSIYLVLPAFCCFLYLLYILRNAEAEFINMILPIMVLAAIFLMYMLGLGSMLGTYTYLKIRQSERSKKLI